MDHKSVSYLRIVKEFEATGLLPNEILLPFKHVPNFLGNYKYPNKNIVVMLVDKHQKLGCKIDIFF